MILADKIILLRKQSGWSQEQLAEQLGISRQSVSKWESGMSVPDLDKIVKMSALFGVSTDYLLKDEMEEITTSEVQEQDDACRVVTAEEAHAYMSTVQSLAKKMALAVALLVFSPVPLLFLGGLSELEGTISENVAGGVGVCILLVLIVLGVLPLINYGMQLSKYEYLEKESISLQYGVKGIVEKRKAEYEGTFRSGIIAGVALCVLGVIPVILNCFFEGSAYEDFIGACTVCVLLVFVAIGVFFFTSCGMVQDSFNKLLQLEDYSVEKKRHGQTMEMISGVYWCLATAVYLAISFIWDSWGTSWIVWPVAGVLYAVVIGIAGIVLNNRNR